ncbi:MAG: tetratricopeptide repeat protein, partial [Planctomycetia bacterium]|nr:tetratricopeptide repeat protein [Planctomycetia bacterium]
MAQDMPRPSIGTPPVGLVAGGLIAAACGLWLAATTISRVSPPAEEPRAAAGALVARGRTLLEAQRLAAAYDCFAEAVRLDPAAADGHRGLAAVAYDQGSLMQAVTHLEHAAALDPDDGRPWRMIGHICRDLGHHERAVSSYREALGRELAPAARSEVRAELAAAGALAELPDDTTGGPEPLATVMCRAEAIWITEGPEAALRMVTAASERFPEDPGLLGLRGRLLVDQGQWQEAVAPLERAAALDPHDLATLQALATACERLGGISFLHRFGSALNH